MACGASVVFVSPQVFSDGTQPTRWLPLKNKGTLPMLMSWLYHKDEWAKRHPVFDGLPSGGMMNYAFYREIIPDAAFVGQDPPLQAIAGANNVSFDYASGLTVAEYQLGAGRLPAQHAAVAREPRPRPAGRTPAAQHAPLRRARLEGTCCTAARGV